MNESFILSVESIFYYAYYEKSESFLFKPEIQKFLRNQIKNEKGIKLIKLYILLESAPSNEKERIIFEEFLKKQIKKYSIIEDFLQTEKPKDNNLLFNFYSQRLEKSKNSKIPNLYFHISQTAIHDLLALNDTFNALNLIIELDNWASNNNAPISMCAYVNHLFSLYHTYFDNDFDLVKKYSEKAISLSLKGNEFAKSNIPLFQMHLANSFMKKGNIKRAIEILTLINKELNVSIPLKISILCYTGEAYFRKNNFEYSLKYFNLAYNISKKHGRKDLVASSLLMIAACNLRTKKPENAYKIYLSALKVAKLENLTLHQLKIYEGIISLNLNYTLNIPNKQKYFFNYKKIQEQIISEKKQLDLIELEKKYETNKIKELFDFQNKFYNFISHEFKTPISVILAQNELLSHKFKSDPDTYKKLESISSNSLQILNLTNTILDISKLENNQFPINNKYGNIIQEIKEILEKFLVLSVNKKQHLKITLPNKSIYCHFDKTILEKIIDNLLSNAIKFTKLYGKVSFLVSYKDNKLTITVKDNGIGLNQDEKKIIFNRFQSVNLNNSINPIGTGLGLSLVKELCALLNGEIIVKSKLHSGTTFSVTIPIKAINVLKNTQLPVTELIIPKTIDFSQISLENKKELKKYSILIIEDNAELNEFLCNFFKKDYNILQAFNGHDGEKIAIEKSPDLIISDIMMPIKSGIELCKSLKNNLITNHIPIILLTAKNDNKSELLAIKNLAADYIKKPFSITILEAKVQNILTNRNILQKYFQNYIFNQDIELKPNKIERNHMSFINIFKKTLNDSLFNKDLSVEFIARKMNISRMTLLRKIKFYTNKNVKDLVTEAKMKKAFELLSSKSHTVKKVAELLGYRKVQVFQTNFKSYYGKTPGSI